MIDRTEDMRSSEALKNWKECNEVTMSFLESVPEKIYPNKPFQPRFRPFSWEFACLLTTRQMYINGIKCGNLDGNSECVPEKEAEEYSKEKMKIELARTDELIHEIIKGKEKTITFFGKKTSTPALMSWLMQHEQLHFGKLMIYAAQAGLDQPKELKKMWGEGSFSKS